MDAIKMHHCSQTNAIRCSCKNHMASELLNRHGGGLARSAFGFADGKDAEAIEAERETYGN